MTKRKMYETFRLTINNPLPRVKLWIDMLTEGADDADMLLEFPGTDVIKSTMQHRRGRRHPYSGNAIAIVGKSFVSFPLDGTNPTHTVVPMKFGGKRRMLHITPGWSHSEPDKSLIPRMVNTLMHHRDVVGMRREDVGHQLAAFNDWPPLRMAESPTAQNIYRGLSVAYEVAALMLEPIEAKLRQATDDITKNNVRGVRSMLCHIAQGNLWDGYSLQWHTDNDVVTLDSRAALLRGIKLTDGALENALLVCDQDNEYPEGVFGDVLRHLNKFQTL